MVLGAISVLAASGACSPEESATPEPSPTPTTPSPTVTEIPEPDVPVETNLDEDAILSMLQRYLNLYNRGGYDAAARFISASVQATCGGEAGVAQALAQNHDIERIDYDADAVEAWDDEPDMADVMTVEDYGGDSYEQPLGLAFSFEDGDWKLDDLYPLGAGAFC